MLEADFLKFVEYPKIKRVLKIDLYFGFNMVDLSIPELRSKYIDTFFAPKTGYVLDPDILVSKYIKCTVKRAPWLRLYPRVNRLKLIELN